MNLTDLKLFVCAAVVGLSVSATFGQPPVATNPHIDSLQLILKSRDISDLERVNVYVLLANEHGVTDSLSVMKYVNKAISLADSVDYGEGKADAYHPWAWMLMIKGHTNTARSLFNRMLEYSEIISYPKGIANSHSGIGATLWYEGDYYGALDHHEKALSIFLELGDKGGISNTYNNIGDAYSELGDYVNALHHLLKSLETAESEADIATTYSNIGLIYERQGAYANSLKYYEDALHLYSLINDKWGISNSYVNIGNVNQKNGKFENAIKAYNRVLELSKTSGYERIVSQCYYQIGTTYNRMNDYERAVTAYKKSLESSIKLESSRIIEAKVYQGWGEAELKMNHIYKAEELLNKALVLTKNLNREAFYLEAQVLMAELYAKRKDYKASLAFLDRIEASIRPADHQELRRKIIKIRTDIYYATEDYKKAFENFSLYKELSDSIQSKEVSDRLIRIEAEFDFKQEKDSLSFAAVKQRLNYEMDIADRQKNLQAIVAGFILVLMLTAVIFALYQTNKSAGRQLKELNDEIRLQNAEIKSKNEDLESTLSKLEETQVQLIKSEKMASLGVLASGMAHEINNPMNFIRNSVNLISSSLEDDNKNRQVVRSSLPIIEEGIDRIVRIIQSLDYYSSQDATFNSDVNLHETLDNCLVALKPKLKSSIDVIKAYETNDILINGDMKALYHVFLNVISNAIESIEKKGTVTLTTCSKNEDIVITVVDSGVGIPRKIIDKIGDPFFTTKEPGSGVGLGIYIAKDILSHHRGKIRFDSVQGNGTAVEIRLPNNYRV